MSANDSQRTTAVAIGWAATRRRMIAHLLLFTVLATMAFGARPPAAVPDPGHAVRVIVSGYQGLGAAVERAVAEVGGHVAGRLRVLDGVVAEVPAGALDELSRSAAVRTVTPDRRITMSHAVDGYNPVDAAGSAYNLNRAVKAPDAWGRGYTGEGIDVAVIDTGVVPVNGLTAPGAVVHGPDLSFEAPNPDLRYLDTYGHGTPMAGIIAGRDDAAAASGNYTSHDPYVGVAPGARIVSIKIADANGVADVSQVIAAVDWVIAHRNTDGLNIRVMNLSFGTDGTQWYRIDPLATSVEMAWRLGVVVVVSAGNHGFGDEQMNNPAYDPYVIAVGSSDTKGTSTVSDDEVPPWSARGNALRHPDIVAPGKSVVGLRSPGSHLDQTFPGARVGSRFMRGSGTSQSAAVVSGAAALLLDQRPYLTPDQVKKILMDSATPLPNADALGQGAGTLNVKAAINTMTPLLYFQNHPVAGGDGSLEGARGTMHVSGDGVELRGEVDIFNQTVDTDELAALTWLGTVWSGGDWNGQTWSGQTWSGQTWSGQTWSGQTWSAQTWSAQTWSAQTWSGQTWSGQTWSGQTWSGQTWSGQTWSGQTWSGQTWSGQTWSGQTWSSAEWA